MTDDMSTLVITFKIKINIYPYSTLIIKYLGLELQYKINNGSTV